MNLHTTLHAIGDSDANGLYRRWRLNRDAGAADLVLRLPQSRSLSLRRLHSQAEAGGGFRAGEGLRLAAFAAHLYPSWYLWGTFANATLGLHHYFSDWNRIAPWARHDDSLGIADRDAPGVGVWLSHDSLRRLLADSARDVAVEAALRLAVGEGIATFRIAAQYAVDHGQALLQAYGLIKPSPFLDSVEAAIPMDLVVLDDVVRYRRWARDMMRPYERLLG